MNSFAPDPCCGKPLAKALMNETLAHVNSWECPKCGTEWKPRLSNPLMRYWEPQTHAALFGGKR